MAMKRAIVLSMMATVALTGLQAQEPQPLEFNPRTVLKNPLPAITNAAHLPAAQATPELVNDNELVLGVMVGGQARAYPINMLTGPRREIINDTLGGRRIAATW